MIDIQELVGRYVAVWNEPDPGLRRETVAGLWAKNGVHRLQPPLEIRDAAGALGLTAVLEARGHQELEVRVTRSYEEFVAPGTFLFRSRGDAARLGDIVTFTWEMVPAGGGEPAGAGLEVLVLDEDGRIRADHQFIKG